MEDFAYFLHNLFVLVVSLGGGFCGGVAWQWQYYDFGRYKRLTSRHKWVLFVGGCVGAFVGLIIGGLIF